MTPKVFICWLIAYFIYLAIGGGVFHAIERPLELERCDKAETYFEFLTETYNRTDNQTNITLSELQDIISVSLM